MQTRAKPKPVKTHNVSFPPSMIRAIPELIAIGGYGGVSDFIQALVRERAVMVYGPKWAELFADEEEGEAA
jgi:Arc/MetJ-type ribon-helix-helix transcriptional regulator